MIFVVIIVCVVLAVGLYFGLMSSGILPDEGKREATRPGRTGAPSGRLGSSTNAGSGMFGIFPRVPHLRELPQGCLIGLIVAATLWFIAWTVILVVAMNLLRSSTS